MIVTYAHRYRRPPMAGHARADGAGGGAGGGKKMALTARALATAGIIAILVLLSGCIPPPVGYPHEASHDDAYWRHY